MNNFRQNNVFKRLREEHYFCFKKKGLKSKFFFLEGNECSNEWYLRKFWKLKIKIVSNNFLRDKFEEKINKKKVSLSTNVYLQFVTYRFINVINWIIIEQEGCEHFILRPRDRAIEPTSQCVPEVVIHRWLLNGRNEASKTSSKVWNYITIIFQSILPL